MEQTISALIIIHNEEKILSSCLERLQFCDEIIVILDNCSDQSINIAKNYTSLIYEGSWNYEGDRRNFGIEKANGEYIAFCDDDDIWHKSKLEIQIKYS